MSKFYRMRLSIQSYIRDNWSLIVALFLLLATITFVLVVSLRENQGHFVYPLDDTYIHGMAMSKNIVRYGVWGIDKYAFTSSTSSPLWTVLTSLCYRAFGVNEITPFVLNIICAILIVGVFHHEIKKIYPGNFVRLGLLVAVMYATPLPALIFVGMEHTLHALLTFLFALLAARIISSSEKKTSSEMLLLLLSPFLATVRYEGLFLVFAACALFVVRKRILFALLVGGVAALPVVLYGFISLSQGYHFIPDSILLKVVMPEINTWKGRILLFGGRGIETMVRNAPHIFNLWIVTLGLFFVGYFSGKKRYWAESPHALLQVLFIASALLHMNFANIGWFYRYEAYLIPFGIYVIALTIKDHIPLLRSIVKNSLGYRISSVFFIILFVLPFPNRGVRSLIEIPRASKNVYEQQYHMGLFLKKYYTNECIAANDIGVINYLADIRCLDLWGLGNREVARLRLSNAYTTKCMHELARDMGAKVAIVYDHWYTGYGGIPTQWIKIGEWKIKNNIICGGDTVSFYAIDIREKGRLIECLREFSPELPRDVRQSGKYIR